ncbi:MAG: anti-sigma regulatory factor [Leptolyngbyaceae bacterium]|nr:anti-sigma regulatory factor [Leptolyngbyaceae bacterium]
MRPAQSRKWGSISFASTLYLCPILDLLLARVPEHIEGEVRLGLQEALVNAATHGNKLDPTKTISVRFFFFDNEYWWIISDQGTGFQADTNASSAHCCLPHEHAEDGRGLFILHQIFDHVRWNADGTELQLCKHIKDVNRFLSF